MPKWGKGMKNESNIEWSEFLESLSTHTTPTPQETDADISPLQYLCTLVDIADEPDETAHAVPSLLTRENQQCCISVLSACLL